MVIQYMQDPSDHLFYDNITPSMTIGKVSTVQFRSANAGCLFIVQYNRRTTISE